jgi:hypothetical protein
VESGTVVSRVAMRRFARTGGWTRSVSRSTPSSSGSFSSADSVSASSGVSVLVEDESGSERASARRRAWSAGCWASSSRIQESVVEDVSCPARRNVGISEQVRRQHANAKGPRDTHARASRRRTDASPLLRTRSRGPVATAGHGLQRRARPH